MFSKIIFPIKSPILTVNVIRCLASILKLKYRQTRHIYPLQKQPWAQSCDFNLLTVNFRFCMSCCFFSLLVYRVPLSIRVVVHLTTLLPRCVVQVLLSHADSFLHLLGELFQHSVSNVFGEKGYRTLQGPTPHHIHSCPPRRQ